MTENTAQMTSPSDRLAIEDPDLLLRDETRGLRFAMEYEKAELALREWGGRSTVVVFGSARIPEAAMPSDPAGHRAHAISPACRPMRPC
jgi:hypothetical protein